jgi:integrase
MRDGLWSLGKRRGIYEAFRYTDADKTRRERRTLNTSSEQEATDLLRQLNDEVVAGGPTTVAACFELYKFHKEQKKKWTKSMERARQKICDEIGSLSPSAISRTLCEQIIDKRLALGLARDTVRIEMAYLRAALKYSEHVKRIERAPFILVPPGGEARERWLTADEVDKLIAGAVELHVKLFIILSVTTAARPSHILQLTWDRVDLDIGVVDFRDPEREASRKRRPRVPINETAMKHLKVAKELKRTDYVIEWREAPVLSIKKGVMRAAQRAGIKGVSQYVLRHTAGVWMAKAGVPMEQIAAYMGHTSLETTRKHYAHFHPQFLRGAAKALEIFPASDRPHEQG